jgi:glycosyltransferase involved in cell wall biosynthesis
MSSVVVSHLGAREHYAVAAMASQHGMLARLVTDFWNPCGPWAERVARCLPWPAVERLAQRRSDLIPLARVTAMWDQGVCSWVGQWAADGARSRSERYLEDGRRFALGVRRYLDVEHTCFFGYSSASLEAIQIENRKGIMTILDQIDAARVADEIGAEEQSKHSALFQMPVSRTSPEYFNRVQEEWAEASAVVVNSGWSRDALVRQGVDAAKISVIPLTYNPCATLTTPKVGGSILRVLWLGRLSPLKGIAYALEAARHLERANLRFTFAGPLDIPKSAFKLPANADYVGVVSRFAAAELYQAHDLFLFPTLSDGFGITQLEAMAHGLPVIATERCGRVVEHGKSGFLVKPADAEGITEAILRFMREPEHLRFCSGHALARARDFHPDQIWPLYRQIMDGK